MFERRDLREWKGENEKTQLRNQHKLLSNWSGKSGEHRTPGVPYLPSSPTRPHTTAIHTLAWPSREDTRRQRVARNLCSISSYFLSHSHQQPQQIDWTGVGTKNYCHHHGNVLSFPMEECKIVLGTRRRNWRQRKPGQSEPITNHPRLLGKAFFLPALLPSVQRGAPTCHLCSFFQWCPSHVWVGWGVCPSPGCPGMSISLHNSNTWSATHPILTTEQEGAGSW